MRPIVQIMLASYCIQVTGQRNDRACPRPMSLCLRTAAPALVAPKQAVEGSTADVSGAAVSRGKPLAD